MRRYFLEVTYKGTRYSGFQVQTNAITIQSEVEKALTTLFRQPFSLTGSSRTDAGVHAFQNFFHFDTDIFIRQEQLYNLNAILPSDIAVKGIYPVENQSHCRFDAVSREYKYFVYKEKNPFLQETAWYYPFKLDMDILQNAAAIIPGYKDFTSFSKRNTQVKTFICDIKYSSWAYENDCLVFTVISNRFLRGMVRGLVSTMFKTARNIISIDQFREIIEQQDCTKADFAAPPQGLYLVKVNYKDDFLGKVDNG
ncbi:tRNA pseudouridine(38-40) synthase TruA [Panacibacter ginsenosidivorans]|uniref:tRNA pseudouridine synthase A n=1 Tax=Panacibacter ginsenosidivorans TaxID=1813871 RepID=A0A5B8V6F5_9BACT|nr:tRNA pseudouridine(38-40) synthase TruA [Panacibacter ginsenosidivorans]QEC67040.1 tRNA pseudouridine(38-40) synthase TruA [Panacibacter ginsenosidivorans]